MITIRSSGSLAVSLDLCTRRNKKPIKARVFPENENRIQEDKLNKKTKELTQKKLKDKNSN